MNYLTYIKYGGLALSYLAVIWATHHYDKLQEAKARNVVLQKQMNEVEHVVTVHNQVNRLPIGDAGTQLLLDWQR